MERDNLAFVPRPIDAVGLKLDGAGIRVPIVLIQRTAALRAYCAFAKGRDWMEKISSAYVVALATRSADLCLMRQIQASIVEEPVIPCAGCREATFGVKVIRAKLFPELARLREFANAQIHHLDDPSNRGVEELNVQGVFDYCYHLFQEQSDLLLGTPPEGSFEYQKCKRCRARAGSAE